MKRLISVLCCCLALMGCARGEEKIVLVSINVGKADCHLLYAGETLYMIDTGTAESWGMVSRALTILGVDHLDGVILTHTDKDHAGGLQALASSSVQVDAWYSSCYYTDVKQSKHPAVLAAALRGAEVVWLQAGDTLPVDEGVLQVLGPVRMDEEKENNNSLVLRLDAAAGSILLTGDMEKKAEEALMEVTSLSPVTVLKVGHHGENDATSEDFATAVRPQVAVISTNTEEEEDTPDPRVLSLLDSLNTQVVQTQDVDGAVRITLTGGQPLVELVTFTPPPVTAQVVISDKSIAQDAITLRNDGAETVDLSGWYLFSEKGKEIFVFPQGASLSPGASCTITTQSSESPGDYQWQETRVWHEEKSDTALLYDCYGQLVSQLE